MRSLRLLLLTIACVAPLLAQRGDKRGEEQKPLPEDIKVPPAPVRTPEEEAATFKLAPGFRAELIAADPLVGDPIAMQFGPDGRLWVLEMRGYMPNADGIGEREPVGIVAVLMRWPSPSDGPTRCCLAADRRARRRSSWHSTPRRSSAD